MRQGFGSGLVACPWLLLFLGAPEPARGTALYVPSEYATINAALDASSAGDSVLVAPGVYSDYEVRILQGGGPFTASSIAFLKGGVTLIGVGGRESTRIDLAGQGAGHAVPVLVWGDGSGTAVVQGFTIAGAPPENAGLWSRFVDAAVIQDCLFEGLDGGSRDAGGIYSLGADLDLGNCEFRMCRGTTEGAAVSHGEGDAMLTGCSFVSCEGSFVVLLDAIGVSPPFAAEVRECTFRDNRGLGAAIANYVTLTVEDCVFADNVSTGGSALIVSGGAGGIVEPGPYTVRRNLFARNQTTSGIGAFNWDAVSGTIEENTFVGTEGRALTLTYRPPKVVALRGNIFAGTTGAVAVDFVDLGAPSPSMVCNDFWGNVMGDTYGFSPGPTDLFVDPLFCGADTGDYTLARNSPCLPAQSGSCGQIGAFGEGCAEISVEPGTWGKTKAMYRQSHERRERR